MPRRCRRNQTVSSSSAPSRIQRYRPRPCGSSIPRASRFHGGCARATLRLLDRSILIKNCRPRRELRTLAEPSWTSAGSRCVPLRRNFPRRIVVFNSERFLRRSELSIDRSIGSPPGPHRQLSRLDIFTSSKNCFYRGWCNCCNSMVMKPLVCF